MRKRVYILILVLVSGIFTAPIFASFTFPRSVYRMDQLSDALEMARAQNRPITFIYTNEKTTCPLATAASLDVLEALQGDTVMVYASTERDEDWRRLPVAVKRALRSPEAGRYIPKTVVMAPDMQSVRQIIPYVRDVGERRANLAKVKSAIR